MSTRPGRPAASGYQGHDALFRGSLRGDGRLRGKSKHPGFLALHVAVDDHSRMAFTQMLPDQKAETTIGFLHSASTSSPATASAFAHCLPITAPATAPASSARLASRLQHQTPPYQALYPQNQRKSRALHPNRPARMGLCKTLDRLRAKRRSLAALDRLLQPRTTSW